MSVPPFRGFHAFLGFRRRHPEFPVGPDGTELHYDPAEMDPAAPRLHIRKENGVWELRDGDGVVLSRHPRLPGAIDAAQARSRACFHEILVRGAASAMEWSVRHNPEMVELARVLNLNPPAEREAAD